MHLAPAVNYSVKRSRWHARLIASVSLLAVFTLAAFARDQMALDERTGVLTFAILMASILAFIGWKRSPQGTLRWDGEHWVWSGFAGRPACRLGLIMDFQSVMLVTIKAEVAQTQSTIFLWLEAIPGDASWRPLRRAIVSSQAITNSNGKDRKTAPSVQGDVA